VNTAQRIRNAIRPTVITSTLAISWLVAAGKTAEKMPRKPQ
jgi:hypothetical protein